MSVLLSFLLSYLLFYRYAALFVIVFSASMILPLPVTELMLAIGAFVNQSYFDPWLSFTVAESANVLGDLADYFITRKYGYAPLHKLKLSKTRLFKKMEEELNVHARSTIFVTRMAGGLGPIVNFMSGALGIGFKKFVLYDFLGNALYYAGTISLGYLAGSYWENFSELTNILIGILVVVIIMKILWHIYRRIKTNHAERMRTRGS